MLKASRDVPLTPSRNQPKRWRWRDQASQRGIHWFTEAAYRGGLYDGAAHQTAHARRLAAYAFPAWQKRGRRSSQAAGSSPAQHTSSCSTTSHSASLVCRTWRRGACGLSTSTKPSSPSVAVGSSSSPGQHTHTHTHSPPVTITPRDMILTSHAICITLVSSEGLGS